MNKYLSNRQKFYIIIFILNLFSIPLDPDIFQPQLNVFWLESLLLITLSYLILHKNND